LDTINNLKPDSCIIRGNNQNLKNIHNLQLDKHIPHLYLLSNSNECNFNLLPHFEFLFWEESLSYEDNIDIILNTLQVSHNNSIINKTVKSYKYWDFISKTATPFTIDIDTGFFHRKKKLSFSYSNGTCLYRDSNDVLKEIEYLVKDLKQRKFHIDTVPWAFNHREFCCFLKDFAEGDLNKFNFSWSCSVLPEQLHQIISDETLVNNLKTSNLGQIFVPLEHVSETILNSLVPFYDKNLFIEDLKKLRLIGIPSIVIEYVIGSDGETADTLNDLITYSYLILKEIPCVEFRILHYYEIDERSRCLEYNQSINRELHLMKQYIYSKLIVCVQQNIRSMTLQDHIKLLNVSSCGIKTQIATYFLSRTPLINIHRNTKNNRLLKFSFEIDDNLLEYRPVFHSSVEYDDDNTPYIQVSPFLTQEGMSKRYLNKYEQMIAEQTKRYKTINSIIDYISEKEGVPWDKIKEITFSFLFFLENVGLLNYSRMLKR